MNIKMYRRFLNKNDYLGVITDTALSQLVRDNQERFVQAEQAAEASIIDYLTENYEIEEELNKGKRIIEYNRKISYPVGSHFYFNDKICEVIKAINGYKVPCEKPYWKVCEELLEVSLLPKYSQMNNYFPGNIVQFVGIAYVCDIENGYGFNNVRIPGIMAWKQVDVKKWEEVPFKLWDVVEHNGQFFALADMSGYEPFVDPMTSNNWGLIGEYDRELNTYELSDHEYVVYNNKVYYPIVNPNADTPALETNIVYHDPRNYNLKRHMVQLAMYELHKLISPHNMSSVRIDDYEHSMQWLKDASRLKLNPQIPRKVNSRNEPLTDWQIATFQTSYDPYQNPWQV